MSVGKIGVNGRFDAAGTWFGVITCRRWDPGIRSRVEVGRIINVGIVHVGACHIKAHIARHEYYWGLDVGF